MKKKSFIDDYLKHYAVRGNWKFVTGETEPVSQVVVIPVLAEKESLFHTLASLAENDASALEYSLVVCVVNNQENSSADIKDDNQFTLEYLDTLVRKKSIKKIAGDDSLMRCLSLVSDSRMKLGYIDASSHGCELPVRGGGVGMARKIGMDSVLRLSGNGSQPSKIIISLDADTLVQKNYLSVIHDSFKPGVKTAIVAYEHQTPSAEIHQAAILCYEIFLRYWVLGLKYAGSPRAFHSIGSTISVSTEAYLEVRGMNKREAGEDFYFLNKLAKVGRIDYIRETCVYPSARPSNRVPFGTGKRVSRFLSSNHQDEYRLYDPQVFSVLKHWLHWMTGDGLSSGDDIIRGAERIHPALKNFLVKNDFRQVWTRIRSNVKDETNLRRHFHDWFDGFRTLKMIHHLTETVYPQISMFAALERMLAMSGLTSSKYSDDRNVPNLPEQREILTFLRKVT